MAKPGVGTVPASPDEMAPLLGESGDHAPPAEGTFDAGRRRLGFLAGPIVFIAVWFLPFDLTAPQRTLAAILGLVITYWVTEAIPVPATALLGLALAAFLGVAAPAEVLAGFATPTIFLFIGSFMIARAMSIHGLDRRFALRILSLPRIAGSTYGTLFAFGLVAAMMSAFISNTAATAMLLPIGIGIVAIYRNLIHEDSPERDPGTANLSAALMLMIAYAASVGGLLTPIGSPPNLLGRRFLEEQAGMSLPFLRWMAITAPMVLVALGLLFVTIVVLNRPEARRIPGAAAYIRGQRRLLGRWSTGERNTLLAFSVAVSLWLAPGVVGIVAGEQSDAYAFVRDRLDEGVVALVAACLLFVLPLDRGLRTFTINWRQAVTIDWGTILLFGAGIALGTLLTATGLAGLIGEGLAATLGGATPFTLTLLAVLAAILISETTSNTASVGIVVPIVISLAAAAGLDPAVPAMAAVFGVSFGFMLPVSTPPNAIVYGSGMVPITRMIRTGLVFDLIGAIVIATGVTVWAGVVGFR
jgi:solute carrier family 13 (sodium-dependent dicarboxylate transporter), member 2/3/5